MIYNFRMSSKTKRVSVNYIKNEFFTVGLIFCVYILLVLYLLSFLGVLVNSSPNLSFIANNEYLYVGIVYLLFVIGTLVPVLTMVLSSKVKISEFWRHSSCKFSDIIVSTVVFISLGTASMFLMVVLNSYFPLGEELVSPIGLTIKQQFLFNPLYVFLFVVVSPILEEVAFRGVLLRVLGKYGNQFAMWAIALFYALSHTSFSEIFPSFIMSLFLTKVTLRYRSVQPTIVIHVLYNLFLYAFSIISPKYYFVLSIVLFLLYFLSIIFIFTKKYRFVKIKKQDNPSVVWKSFLTSPTIVISILLVIAHSVIMTLF